MAKLYIENTFFEEEILCPNKSLYSLFHSHPHILQLQFLPLLYANKEDTVVVSNYPETSYLKTLKNPPNLMLLEEFISTRPLEKTSLWAPSKALCSNLTLPFSHAKKIHAKSFCFENTKKLPFSILLYTPTEVRTFLEKNNKPKLLKTIYGKSGSGHFRFPSSRRNLNSFLNREFSHKRPIIGQYWMEKCLDFSTQWQINKESICLIGKTIIENTFDGSYLKTHLNQDSSLLDRFYKQHLKEAMELLLKAQKIGFIGPIGVDAMIYKEDTLQHQILELNARKTMSLIALNIAKKQKLSSLAFQKGKNGLLPTFLKNSKKTTYFPNNLQIN